MHSSTSSFERPVPGGRWGATWLVALAIVAVAAVSWEMFLRSRGYEPSVKDDEYAWAWQRSRVSDGSTRTVAVLGSSRIMLAFSPQAFAEVLPGWKYAQLAVNGTTPIGTLRDLAADPSFRGIALVDVSDQSFYPQSWSAQDAYIEAYRRRWRHVGAMVERVLATEVQSRLAMLSTRGIATFGRWWRNGTFPTRFYVTTYPDRTRYADYELTDVGRRRRAQLDIMEVGEDAPGDLDNWLAGARAVEADIAAIQARGGHVVYVRMPTCRERWDKDQIWHPKEQFWDRFAASTKALAIHFKDYPELSKFECPDTSHIASKDGVEFTRSLLRIIQARLL